MSNVSSADLLDAIIEKIYDAALNPERWPDLLEALADTFEAADAEKDPETQQNHMSFVAEAPTIHHIGLSQALRQSRLLTDDTDVASVSKSSGSVTETLLRHFARAIQVIQKLTLLDDRYQVALSILNRLPLGVFVIDKDARIICQNELSDSIIQESDQVAVIDGRLQLRPLKQHREFCGHIRSAHSKKRDPTSNRTMMLRRAEGTSEDLLLLITQMEPNFPMGDDYVMVLVGYRKHQALKLSVSLQREFRLTEREVAVAEAIAKGCSVKDIAHESCCSVHTIRNQLKSVLAKTKVHRQSDLVRLVLEDPSSRLRLPIQSDETIYEFDEHFHYKSGDRPPEVKFFCLSNGKRVAYREYGDPEGQPLLLFHSVIGSSLETPIDVEPILRKNHYRMVIPERPGYGLSDAQYDVDSTEIATQFKALLDELAIKRVMVVGHVLGCVYAMAFMHRYRQTVRRAVLLMPPSSDNPQFFKEMGPLYRLNNIIAFHSPSMYSLYSYMMIRGIRTSPASFSKLLARGLDEEEAKLVTSPTFKIRLKYAFSGPFRSVAKCVAREVTQLNAPWAFFESSIDVPTVVWHGERDNNLPVSLSRHVAKRLKNSRLEVSSSSGHFLYYKEWDRILQSLQQE